MNWKINLWASLLDGDRTLTLIRDQISPAGGTGFYEAGATYPKMFDARRPPPFQVDGNFGFTSGVAEMLAQSHDDGAAHVMPALSNAWPKGETKGLAMRGGFIIDMKWKSGDVTFLKVRSNLGGNLRIRSNSPLPVASGFTTTSTHGANPNPFYSVPSLKSPMKHTKRHVPRLSLDNSYLIDVTTETGGEYI